MAITGRNKQARTLAEIIDVEIIPRNQFRIAEGLKGFFAIHNNTNELVMQGDSKLNDVLLEKDTLRTYVLAISVELMEFLQTLDWKPWKNGKPESNERILDEFADIMAFFGVLVTLMKAMGFSEEKIAEAYIKKEHVNVQRFITKMQEDEDADNKARGL